MTTPEDAEAMVALALEQATEVAFNRWVSHADAAEKLYELDDAEAQKGSAIRSHKAAEADAIRAEISALRPDAIAALARLREADRAEIERLKAELVKWQTSSHGQAWDRITALARVTELEADRVKVAEMALRMAAEQVEPAEAKVWTSNCNLLSLGPDGLKKRIKRAILAITPATVIAQAEKE